MLPMGMGAELSWQFGIVLEGKIGEGCVCVCGIFI